VARTTLIRNLAQIATPVGGEPRRGTGMRQLRIIDRAAIVIRDGRFAFVGPEADLPDVHGDEIDGGGATALPGFVDAHTHAVFAGTRENEFNRRLGGETYADIAASGGGIAASVRATRQATETELVATLLHRTSLMAEHGTTTAEVKSGYGLTRDDELKQLRAIRAAAQSSPVHLLSTCLAAHDFPPESRSDPQLRTEYVRTVTEEILPAVAREKLATFCDVFVEQGAFSPEQGATVLTAGTRLGFVPRVHADEFTDSGGARLAVEQQCASADHLMAVSDDGIKALAASKTVANLLPATSFFLMSERFAPARKLIDAGAIVALSTDCNPGSSMTESMQIVIQLASLQMRMTVEEALTAATLHSAYSLGLAKEVGSIEEGKRADLVLLDAPNYLHLVYHFGVNLVRAVFRNGEQVINRASL
jgi:imidazolonepropionase